MPGATLMHPAACNLRRRAEAAGLPLPAGVQPPLIQHVERTHAHDKRLVGGSEVACAVKEPDRPKPAALANQRQRPGIAALASNAQQGAAVSGRRRRLAGCLLPPSPFAGDGSRKAWHAAVLTRGQLHTCAACPMQADSRHALAAPSREVACKRRRRSFIIARPAARQHMLHEQRQQQQRMLQSTCMMPGSSCVCLSASHRHTGSSTPEELQLVRPSRVSSFLPDVTSCAEAA